MKEQSFGMLNIDYPISPFFKTQLQIDKNNLNRWRLEAPSQMLKKLNEEAADDDNRYRNIDKPLPLL